MSDHTKQSRFGITYNRVLGEKLVRDITRYVKLGEYGKASELLLIIVENGTMPISRIWQPLIATIRGQGIDSQIDSLLDTISHAMRKHPPYIASMERIYNLLDRGDLAGANRTAMTFIEDHGSKLAFAHGYRGMLIACMREVDIQRKYSSSMFVENCEFHVFENSKYMELRLTKDDPELVSIFSLRDAESYLRKALALDPGVDMFRAFHTQVLIAMEMVDLARKELEMYYAKHPDIHILRMLISIDPRNPLDQKDRFLEYFEKDPYAPSEMFQPMLQQIIGSVKRTTDAEFVHRILSIVIDRIELGDYKEEASWSCFENILLALKEHGHWGLVVETMKERISWWNTFYFSDACSMYKELDSQNLELRDRCRNLLLSDKSINTM